MPFRSELLRAQPVSTRRLRRLAKLGFSRWSLVGREEHEDFGENSECRSQNVGGTPAAGVLSDGGGFCLTNRVKEV